MSHLHSSNIGESRPRVEDAALLRGRGRFAADLALPGTAYAAFARSPVARARLVQLRTSAAENLPGVLAVIAAPAIAALGTLTVNSTASGMRIFRRPLLAVDRLNAVGESVAIVVAESLQVAQQAADLIEIDYEVLEPAVELSAAMTGPALFADWPDNEAFLHRWEHGDVGAAFAAAAHVIQIAFSMPRVAPLPLETRGTVAQWTPKPAALTIWLGTQTPHRARAELARILGLSEAAVRVVTPDVGGAFGGKASLYPEDVLVAFAARRLQRPVKWIATRNEDFVSASHGRGGQCSAEAAVDAQGHLTALRADLRFPLGLWGTDSAAVPALNAARILPGPYRVPAVDIRARGFVTNTAPVGIYRGAGRPEAAMIMERLIAQAAVATGLDPAELRRRNLLPPTSLPRLTPTGQRIDSGDYPALLERALTEIGYPQLRRLQAERRARGELYGIGLCSYVEPCGQGWESARISLGADGRYLVACGTSSQGQGHRTALAQIAADCLAAPFDHVDIIEGDTLITPAGVGALASRSIAIGGSAIKRAAEELRAKLAAGADPRAAPVSAEVVYTAPHEAWSSGCAVAAVSVERDTGELRIHRLVWVDDIGLAINPRLVRGQLLGGLAQGLGQILCEQIHYDADGQLLTGSLMDYAILRADQMPIVELHSLATRTDANALGAKGVGESGCIVAPALILDAALDALRPLGVTDLSLPLTSHNLWRAMQP